MVGVVLGGDLTLFYYIHSYNIHTHTPLSQNCSQCGYGEHKISGFNTNKNITLPFSPSENVFPCYRFLLDVFGR